MPSISYWSNIDSVAGGIGNRVVAGVQRLRPQEIARRRQKRRVAEAGHLRHLPQAHVGAHGDDAGKDEARIGFLFDVTVQNVGEGAQKACLSGDEPQQVGDADARQLPVERTVQSAWYRFGVGTFRYFLDHSL